MSANAEERATYWQAAAERNHADATTYKRQRDEWQAECARLSALVNGFPVPASNLHVLPDAEGIFGTETIRAAQSALDAIIALDSHLATLAPDATAYGSSTAGLAALRAYFATIDAISATGLLIDAAETLDAISR